MTDFYSRICSLAINCNFGASLTSILTDKFVCGLKKGKVLDRVCEEPATSSLDKLKAVAVSKEEHLNSNMEDVNYVKRKPFTFGERGKPEQGHGGSAPT